MSDAQMAAQIIDALEAGANNAAGAKTALVSVNIEMLAPGGDGAADVSIARKTRTLVFLHADFRNPQGAPIAIASSVHKILG